MLKASSDVSEEHDRNAKDLPGEVMSLREGIIYCSYNLHLTAFKQLFNEA